MSSNVSVSLDKMRRKSAQQKYAHTLAAMGLVPVTLTVPTTVVAAVRYQADLYRIAHLRALADTGPGAVVLAQRNLRRITKALTFAQFVRDDERALQTDGVLHEFATMCHEDYLDAYARLVEAYKALDNITGAPEDTAQGTKALADCYIAAQEVKSFEAMMIDGLAYGAQRTPVAVDPDL